VRRSPDRCNAFACRADYLSHESIDSSDAAQLEPFIEQNNSLVGSDDLFFAHATIGGNPKCETCQSQWQYQPFRRAIDIADIESELGKLELRCERGIPGTTG
jgi:hypothetical protein